MADQTIQESSTKLKTSDTLQNAAATETTNSKVADNQVQVQSTAAKCRILSFCGGGIRGLLSATLLKLLNKKFPNILGQATFLAGTSTGTDLISMVLAGFGPEDIELTYRLAAPNNFKNPNSNANEPGFSVQSLFESQTKLHKGNPPIASFAPKFNLLFTSFNVQETKTGWQPMLFNNFPGSPTANVGLADAVVGSSAMPGMYGSWNGCVDGAFVSHDPTLAAIALAVKNGYELKDISVICFGTGFMQNYITSDTSNWGTQQWLNGDGSTGNQLPTLLVNQTAPCPILNLTMNGTSTSLTQQLSAMMLGDRYAYVDAVLDRVISEVDISPADLDYLMAQAKLVDLSQAETVLSTHWKI